MEEASSIRHEPRRLALVGLLALVALNAVGGAWYGLAGAQGVPAEWLDGSPFDSYLVPSLYLGVVVGGSHAAAALLVAARHAFARRAAILAAAVLASWILAQLLVIGPVSFLQPAMLVAALATTILARPERRR